MTARRRHLLVCFLSLAACGEPPTTVGNRTRGADDVPVSLAKYSRPQQPFVKLLVAGGIFAESAYTACIASYQAQGLPMQQIYELCSTQLSIQEGRGWGPDATDFMMPEGSGETFDPASVSGSCAVADGRYSNGKPVRQETTSDRKNPFDESRYKDTWFNWGGFTHGGQGNPSFHGMSEKEAASAKAEAVTEAELAIAEYNKAREESEKDPNSVLKAAEADRLKRIADEKANHAKKDPNKKEDPPIKTQPPPPGQAVASTGENPTPCEAVLQSAREFLAECHRTGWKSTQCQQLHAKVKGCPDPTQIYVDPDAGYACAAPVDPQLVIDAWTRQCEQRTTPGPDGTSPCTKPDVSTSGRIISADEDDICRNPLALTDPETDGCIKPIEVDEFGQPGIGDLIVWGLGVFGGPIVVLPLPRPPFPIPYRL